MLLSPDAAAGSRRSRARWLPSERSGHDEATLYKSSARLALPGSSAAGTASLFVGAAEAGGAEAQVHEEEQRQKQSKADLAAAHAVSPLGAPGSGRSDGPRGCLGAVMARAAGCGRGDGRELRARRKAARSTHMYMYMYMYM